MSKFATCLSGVLAAAALSMSLATLAEASDRRGAAMSSHEIASARAMQAKAMRANAMRANAMKARAMQAQHAKMRIMQARQAQAAKATMAAAMVTAATLAATDAGECSPYLAKWMMTKNPLAKIQYQACMADDD
jgi:hypothetical protein